MTTEVWWASLYRISVMWWAMTLLMGPFMLGDLISPVWYLAGWAALCLAMFIVTVFWGVDQVRS